MHQCRSISIPLNNRTLCRDVFAFVKPKMHTLHWYAIVWASEMRTVDSPTKQYERRKKKFVWHFHLAAKTHNSQIEYRKSVLFSSDRSERRQFFLRTSNFCCCRLLFADKVTGNGTEAKRHNIIKRAFEPIRKSVCCRRRWRQLRRCRLRLNAWMNWMDARTHIYLHSVFSSLSLFFFYSNEFNIMIAYNRIVASFFLSLPFYAQSTLSTEWLFEYNFCSFRILIRNLFCK